MKTVAIELKRLTEVPKEEIIALLNHTLVRRHMPLAKELINEKGYRAFIQAKEDLWQKHGYGPWAFVREGKFIGWGGLQYEAGDADLALVLHPDHWGMGKTLYEMFILQAQEMNFESITALLPPTRGQAKGLIKLGFLPDGELCIDNERFLRYRKKFFS